MKKEKVIEIKTTTEKLRDILKTKIVSQYPELIVDTIIDNLAESPKGLEHLFMAFIGIKPTTIFEERDLVYINASHIPKWNKDIAKMEQDNLINQGYITGVLVDINLNKQVGFTVEFNGYNTSGVAELFSEAYYEQSLQKVPEDFMED
jgi:hypothetical protein